MSVEGKKYFRLRPSSFRLGEGLDGEICGCGERIVPPRDVCPECGIDTFTGKKVRRINHPRVPANWGENESCQGGGS